MTDVPVEKLQVILNSLIMEFISLELLLQIKKQDHDTGLLCNIYIYVAGLKAHIEAIIPLDVASFI